MIAQGSLFTFTQHLLSLSHISAQSYNNYGSLLPWQPVVMECLLYFYFEVLTLWFFPVTGELITLYDLL